MVRSLSQTLVVPVSVPVAVTEGVISKPLRDSGELERMGMVFPRLFPAEARTWENLCRVRQIFRFERAPAALHGSEVGFSNNLRHNHFFSSPTPCSPVIEPPA